MNRKNGENKVEGNWRYNEKISNERLVQVNGT